MGILNKIKNYFFQGEDEEKEKKEPSIEQINSPGELIGQCGLCGTAIGANERTRDFNGGMCHKKCVKKAKKMFFRGESLANGI